MLLAFRRSAIAVLATVLVAGGTTLAVADSEDAGDPPAPTATVEPAARYEISAPLSELRSKGPGKAPERVTGSSVTDRVRINKPNPRERIDAQLATNPGPPVIPDPTGPAPGEQMPSVTDGFEGMTNPDGYYPPDPDGAIGPQHYVHMVNSSFAIYGRDGTVLLPATATNVLFSALGGDCAVNNDGDPIVQYDQYADRWLLSQFAVSGPGLYECVAVSQTPDPLGTYALYAFEYETFPDYPKFGVWPDGYYVSYNMFDPVTFDYIAAKNCVLERSKMLAGQPARQICFDVLEFSLLPADADGTTPPPDGSPNYFVGEHWDQQDKLTMYKFHTDWDNPADSQFEGPIQLNVNPFTWACLEVTRGRCVPQPDTGVLLESLGARTMYRLAYRNFGTHESLLTNHTVAMDGNLGLTAQTGIGWYELRNLDQATPTVHQQGTTADPDGTTFRTMGSMAQDRLGNMALGYSSSSTTQYPSIEYVGRLAGDPLNTMPQAAGTIKAGAGSQTGAQARWGDYTAMAVDPLDDCTFWYVNQYMKQTSVKNWSTWIANFKYPGCSGSSTVPGAPVSPSVTPGKGEVEVAWTPPADNGGLPVVGYEVVASPGAATCQTRVGVDPDPLRCTLTGLSGATTYTFDVVAINALGDSVAADVQGSPLPVPYPPTAVLAVPGNAQALVSWTAPADDGGSPVIDYTATASPGGATCTSSTTACVVTGLTNGQAYTFTVTARNTNGEGQVSAQSDPVTPFTVPGAPTAVVATASGTDTVQISWSAPGDSGGRPVTSYVATLAPGGASCTSTGTSCTIGGLTAGSTYSVTVVAFNAAGSGPASTPTAVTMPKLTQTAGFTVPKKIKYKGRTVIVKKRIVTNAGVTAKVKLTRKPAKKKYSKVVKRANGRVALRTYGKKKLKVTLKVTAPATAQYSAYEYTKKWTVKKK